MKTWLFRSRKNIWVLAEVPAEGTFTDREGVPWLLFYYPNAVIQTLPEYEKSFPDLEVIEL